MSNAALAAEVFRTAQACTRNAKTLQPKPRNTAFAIPAKVSRRTHEAADGAASAAKSTAPTSI